jgi:hypothetical protein
VDVHCAVQGVSLSTAGSRIVWHLVSPVAESTKMPLLEQVWYRNKGTQSTESPHAGMPMLATSTLMPMSSYSNKKLV